MKTIYLDNNATTFVDPRVVTAILETLEDKNAGNPSSIHSFGQKARQRLQVSRQKIADYFGVRPQEIIFTSGGTEGVNMLLRGVFQAPQGHIVTTNVEHSCLQSSVEWLTKKGVSASYLDVGNWGAPTAEAVRNAIRFDTNLIALMGVNNETGVMTDIDAIADIAYEKNIPFIVDAVSWIGKESLKIHPGVTAMAFSGHKFHAPKGIGFIFLRNAVKFMPLLTGGEQEFGKRAGTENLPAISGIAMAVELLQRELPLFTSRMKVLRDYLENELMSRLDGITVNGLGPRVCNTSSLAFEGIEGEMLLASLDMEGIAVSHGSACASGALEPSRVLLNMGLSKKIASSSLRFSLSRMTTEEEIECCIETIVKVVKRLR